jgi:ATP-binding cassette subfamily B protein
MKLNEKTRAFLVFSRDLLGYKKMTTAVNVFCNAIIFSHQAAVTFCIREILNGLEGTPGQALHNAIPYLAGIILVSLIRIGAIMSCAVLDAKRAYYYQNRLRMNILKKLLHKKNVVSVSGQSGSIFEVMDDDVPASTFPAELLTEVSGHFIYTLIALTMLLAINWQLTLFIFIPLSFAIYGVQRLSERMKERRKKNREAHDAASTFISDMADATLAIKTTGATAAVLNRYDNVNSNRRAAVMKDAVFNERVSVLLNGAVCVGSAVMMFIAARLMAGSTFGIGDFSLFIAHLGTLADCTSRIVELIYEARKAEVSYERIIDVVDSSNGKTLSAGADIELRRGAEAPTDIYPAEELSSFEVKNLSFTYSGEDGFSDVSFTVQPGKMIAIAGGMASGKSTLLSVLMGLMPPDSGDLLWKREPLNSLSDRTPKRIAGTPQRGGFFADDIKTNLCLDIEADDLSITEALKIAALDGIISGSDERLTKNIGDHGDKMSGGQRQRLALARTIIRGAEISIFDDCISALDEDTRKAVLHHLTEYLLKNRRSAIIATNSRSFLESADTVIFMSGGRIEGTGSFEELMQSCAAFSAVVSQT